MSNAISLDADRGIEKPVDVLTAIRAATASQHSRLDRAVPLSRPSPTLADYTEHLCLIRPWLQSFEHWMCSFDSGSQGAIARSEASQTAWLDADLAEAGCSLAVARARQVTPVRWPVDSSRAYRWGACYVLEGSRLGASVLYRRLVGPLSPHPLRYLYGYGEASNARWPQFIRSLRVNVRSLSEIEDACKGARDSFDALLNLCARNESPLG